MPGRGVCLAALAAFIVLAPLVLARELPLLDAPNHLGAIAIWLHHDDPTWGFRDAYALDLRPVPYWGYFGLVRALAVLLPLRVANEIVIGAILCALPAALAFALARHGRSPLLASIAVPLAWSYDLALGFVSYVEGIALLLVAIGALATPPRGRALAGHALLGVAIYFCHPLAFLLWLLALVVWAPRRAPLIAVPGLALFVYAFATSPGRQGTGLAASAFAARWLSPLATLKIFPVRVFDFVDDGWQYALLALTVGTLAALALLAIRSGATTGDDRRPALFAFALLVLAFALPEHLLRPINWWQLSGRLPLVLVLVLPLCLPRARLGRTAHARPRLL